MKENNIENNMIEKISTRDGYGKKLADLSNDKIIVLSADLTESCRVHWFKEKYSERFIQVGISEQDMFGLANGLALEGFIPLTNTFAAFCLRAHEQIRIIALNNSNVKVIGHHSGLTVGEDGVTQQCEVDISLFKSMPNFKVIVPSDAIETGKALLELTKISGPVYLRVSRNPSSIITSEFTPFKIGKANVLREGDDVIIIACGIMVQEALKASKILEEKGINSTVINMHTIKPYDSETIIKYANKIKKIITIEEHSIFGGLGDSTLQAVSELGVFVKVLGINDNFGESGTCEELLIKNGLTADDIVKEYFLMDERIKKTFNYSNISNFDNSRFSNSTNLINNATGNFSINSNNSIQNSNEERENNLKNETKLDPRGRILKMNNSDKEKVDAVLEKMFGKINR